jgi:hypothetical protein
MTVELASPARLFIPVSSSPIMGAPSPAFEEEPDIENVFEIIHAVFKKCTSGQFSFSTSCRNPFEMSKRKDYTFLPDTMTISKEELNVTYKPKTSAYFAYLMNDQNYCSKIYATTKLDGEEKSVTHCETLFHLVPKKTAITFKSISSQFSVICAPITREDIKAFILDSKMSESFSKLDSAEQTKILEQHYPQLYLSIFKIDSIVMRHLSDR